MKITDTTGREITVTNLPAAISEAEFFKDLGYEEQTPEAIAATKERQAYWTDLHNKLLQLQSEHLKK